MESEGQRHQALLSRLRPLLERVRRDSTAVRRDGNHYIWEKSPLTLARLLAHLDGAERRGVALINPGTDVCGAAAIDLDDHDGTLGWEAISAAACRLIDAAAEEDIWFVPFRSGGGAGVHLWALWEFDQDAHSVRTALQAVLATAGLREGTDGVQHDTAEIFPKQASVPTGGYGNLIALPLGGASCPLMRTGDALIPADRDTYPFAWEWSGAPPYVDRQQAPVQPSDHDIQHDIREIRSALDAIDNDADGLPYDEWFQIVCAVHHATGGAVEGLEAISEWSERSWKHDPTHLEDRTWPYIKQSREGGLITAATLFAKAREQGWQPPAEVEFDVVEPPAGIAGVTPTGSGELSHPAAQAALRIAEAEQAWLDRIAKAADVIELRGQIAEGIRSDIRIDKVSRDVLISAWADRISVLGGRKVGLRAARGLLSPTSRQSTGHVMDTPDWLKGWVWSQADELFYNVNTKTALTSKSFDFTYAFDVSSEPGINAESASAYAMRLVGIEKVWRTLYMPQAHDLFDYEGQRHANLYNPQHLPRVPSRPLTQPELDAIQTVSAHLEWLIEDPTERHLFLDWLAWQVQRPGEKIRWAPLIIGQEGDGKTFFRVLLGAVMGQPNVRDVAASQLSSRFTAWAHGAAVVVLEEVMVPGHNRHEATNLLKPLITNDKIEVNPKGQNSFMAPNTTNYLLLTNHHDALPLEDGSRRYLVLKTRFKTPIQLRKALDKDPDHFQRLFDAVKQHPAALRLWLASHQFSAEFEPDNQAYRTAYLSSMVSADKELDDLLEDIIHANLPYISPTVLSLSHLADEVRRRSTSSYKQTARVLRRLGFVPANETGSHGRIRIDGHRLRIWLNADAFEQQPTTAEEFARKHLAFPFDVLDGPLPQK